MSAEKSAFYSPVRIHVTEALAALGYPFTDVNGRRQFGNLFKYVHLVDKMHNFSVNKNL